jgi:uncharacterized protein involved in copper resistance
MPKVPDWHVARQIWLSYDYQTGQYAPAGGTTAHQVQHQDMPHLSAAGQEYTGQQAQQSASVGPVASYYEMPAASSAKQPATYTGALHFRPKLR